MLENNATDSWGLKSVKSILLPVERYPEIGSTIETAVQLARAFESYVEGFALIADPPVLVSADAFSGAMITAGAAFAAPAEENAACRHLFEAGMTAAGLPRHEDGAGGAGGAPGPSFGWQEGDTLTGHAFLGTYGRVFDVTVVGRPSSSADSLRMGALEVALFESGRPVLIAPPAATASLGETIAIAWNGTPEVARSVAFASALLRRARHVDIVTLAGGRDPQPSGELLGRHLRMNGISCAVHHAEGDSESRGAVFLAEAARLGSDLMIKGAYTQSRLRQIIFGGATRHIVTEATLPVFMAH